MVIARTIIADIRSDSLVGRADSLAAHAGFGQTYNKTSKRPTTWAKRTDRRRNAEKLYVWSFVCRLSGCFFFPSQRKHRVRVPDRVCKADLLCERKSDTVLGRGDQRLMSAAVRRTCGAESEWEKVKIGRGRRFQTQKTKNRPSSTYEFESRQLRIREPKLHLRNARCTYQCMQLSDTQSTYRALQYTAMSLSGLYEGFCWVDGWCCLAPADQVSNYSTTKMRSNKNMFVGGRRR